MIIYASNESDIITEINCVQHEVAVFFVGVMRRRVGVKIISHVGQLQGYKSAKIFGFFFSKQK